MSRLALHSMVAHLFNNQESRLQNRKLFSSISTSMLIKANFKSHIKNTHVILCVYYQESRLQNSNYTFEFHSHVSFNWKSESRKRGVHVLNVNVTVMNQFMVITQFITPHTKPFICSSICTAPWSHPDYVEVQFNYLSLIKDFIWRLTWTCEIYVLCNGRLFFVCIFWRIWASLLRNKVC